MLMSDCCGFHKKRARTYYAAHVFLHPEGSADHVVHSGLSGVRDIDTLFFMLRWDRYGFDKSMSGHITVNLCFLYPVASVGYVVHSIVSGA
jgi:hypothetical protein